MSALETCIRIFRGQEDLHRVFRYVVLTGTPLVAVILFLSYGIFLGGFEVAALAFFWALFCLFCLSRCWYNASSDFVQAASVCCRFFFTLWFGALLMLPVLYLVYK